MKRWNVYKKNSRYRACKNMNSNRNFNWNHDRKTADSVSQRFSKFLAFYQWLNSLSFLENDAWVHAYICWISKSSWLNCIFNFYMACGHNYKIKTASILLPPGCSQHDTWTGWHNGNGVWRGRPGWVAPSLNVKNKLLLN